MSLASTVQALVRTLSPPVLGPAFDVDATLPFWITGGTVALTLTCGALLVRHVPRPAATARVGDSSTRRRPETRANGADADAATNGSNGTSGSAVELELGEAVGWDGEAEQERLSRRVEHEARDEMNALCDELTRLRGLKEAHESGEALLEERPPVQVSKADVDELGAWVAGMLETQGYAQWVQHKAVIKAMILNGFPAVRPSPRIDRVSDILNVIMGHLRISASWHDTMAQQEHGVHTAAGMYK